MKSPLLKIKYAKGLGDFITCILSNYPLSKVISFFSKNLETCVKCSQRARALNVLFPFPFWKLFFKDQSSMISSLTADLKQGGYHFKISEDGNVVLISKTDIIMPTPSAQISSDYKLINSSSNELGDLLIYTEIYKKYNNYGH